MSSEEAASKLRMISLSSAARSSLISLWTAVASRTALLLRYTATPVPRSQCGPRCCLSTCTRPPRHMHVNDAQPFRPCSLFRETEYLASQHLSPNSSRRRPAASQTQLQGSVEKHLCHLHRYLATRSIPARVLSARHCRVSQLPASNTHRNSQPSKNSINPKQPALQHTSLSPSAATQLRLPSAFAGLLRSNSFGALIIGLNACVQWTLRDPFSQLTGGTFGALSDTATCFTRSNRQSRRLFR